LLALATMLLVLVVPATSHAAVCADYSNQAAAQGAGDTVDADDDGIYCESLPCPCSTAKPGSTSAPTPPSAAPVVGHPVPLGKRTRSSGCHVRGPLPDPRCTPGSVFSKSTPRVFCKSGYTAIVRHVTDATRRAVFAEYGIKSHSSGQYEVDHLVPLELGGNSTANLFPEAAAPRPGFHDKDRLENKTHSLGCAHSRSFRSMQRAIAGLDRAVRGPHRAAAGRYAIRELSAR
jgi:hypothetical protein